MSIVDELRQDFMKWHDPETALDVAIDLMKRAAGEIERLRARIHKLEARITDMTNNLDLKSNY